MKTFDMFRSLWLYRHFIRSSIQNEMRCRFVRSKFGGLWLVLNPLAQVVIYALILSGVLSAKLPGVQDKYAYAVYLMSGLLAWTLFSEIVTRCLHLFVQQANLLKKLNFPRITLPTITVGTCMLDNFLLLLAMLMTMLLVGFRLSASILWVFPLSLVVVALGVGIGLIVGIINVFVSDTRHVVPIVMQIWFWLTPVVYPVSIIPEQYRGLMSINPLFTLVSAYQGAIVYGQSPSCLPLLAVAGAAALVMLLSLFLFRRASAEMVDVL